MDDFTLNTQDFELLLQDNGTLDGLSFSDNTTIATTETDPLSDNFTETGIDHKPLVSAFILTAFPSTAHNQWLLPETYFENPKDMFKIWCGQFEIGTETEGLHFHLYCEFQNKKRLRFKQLLKLFNKVLEKHPNIRISKRLNKKQRQGAVNYVSKTDTRLNETVPYFWEHNNPVVAFDQSVWDQRTSPKTSKKDEAIEEQRLWIESKPKHWTWDMIVHESEQSKQLLATCSWGNKYHQGRYAVCERLKITNVIILYGAGGTGKTTLAQAWDTKDGECFEERYYKRNPDDGNFWGGGRTAYRGQRIVHFEEFCGQEPFHRMKEILDLGKHGPSVNIKNSGIDLNHETVVITSNNHPAGWYMNMWGKENKQFYPFWRRVTKLVFFPTNREDGSPNIPDKDNPPFSIDQTDDWLKMKGDYNLCQEHAQQHWPLPQQEYEVTGDCVHVPGFTPPNKKARFF